MINAYKNMYKNYFNFNGRTSRKDYWLAFFMNIIVIIILAIIFAIIASITNKPNIVQLVNLYTFVYIIPAISITVRRLHDVNKSGWYYLIAFIPIIGGIYVYYLLLSSSVNENNNYGEQV